MAMEWLALLQAHPAALASWNNYLKQCRADCASSALDGDAENLLRCKGKDFAYQELQAITQNSQHLSGRHLHGVVQAG